VSFLCCASVSFLCCARVSFLCCASVSFLCCARVSDPAPSSTEGLPVRQRRGQETGTEQRECRTTLLCERVIPVLCEGLRPRTPWSATRSDFSAASSCPSRNSTM
jgi:hypothetical protein